MASAAPPPAAAEASRAADAPDQRTQPPEDPTHPADQCLHAPARADDAPPESAPLEDGEPEDEPPASDEQAELPAGWERVVADDGRVYFWNYETDETSWELPRAPAAVSRAESGSSQPETPTKPSPSSSLVDKKRIFETQLSRSGSSERTSERRNSQFMDAMGNLQKQGIRKDGCLNEDSKSNVSQHKLALAALERKAEKGKVSGDGRGMGGGFAIGSWLCSMVWWG